MLGDSDVVVTGLGTVHELCRCQRQRPAREAATMAGRSSRETDYAAQGGRGLG